MPNFAGGLAIKAVGNWQIQGPGNFAQNTTLEPFDHVDPGSRALNHPNPRSFLDGATKIDELTPSLGTEVHGVSLANLNSDERDQLALEVN